jgi:hypothetical protein
MAPKSASKKPAASKTPAEKTPKATKTPKVGADGKPVKAKRHARRQVRTTSRRTTQSLAMQRNLHHQLSIRMLTVLSSLFSLPLCFVFP